MTTRPTVSVIVPTFNREKSVRATIESILSQSYTDYEIIVIDDGSTDETQDTVLAANHPAIRYFYQENQGLPSAWNNGIKKSRGKYVAFLDSDDCWLGKKLALQTAFLEALQAGYPGCVTGYFFQALNNSRTSIVPVPANTSLKELLWKNILHLGTTFMCKREVFDTIGYFDEKLRRGQDTDWLIRYRQKFEIGIVPEVLAVFNQHLIRSAEIMETCFLYFLQKHKDQMLTFGQSFYRRKAATIYRDLAFQFARESNHVKARQYSRMAMATHPLFSPGLILLLIDTHLGTNLKRSADRIKYPGAFQ